MEEFLKKYKLFPTKKLLRIIEKPEDYQRMAVLAAEIELDTRTVSQAEIDFVKNEMQAEKAQLAKRKEETKKVKDKAKAFGSEFFKTISPIQVEPQTTNRKINFILFFLMILSIVSSLDSYDFFYYTFFLSKGGIDSSTVKILTFTLLPIFTAAFWGMRKKTGWILLCFYLIAITTDSIISFLISLGRFLNLKFSYRDPSTIDPDKMVFAYLSNPIPYLAIAIFFLAFLWIVSQPDIKKVFKIEHKTALNTFVGAFFISILMSVFIFNMSFG